MMMIWEFDIFIQSTVQAASQVSNCTKIRQVKSRADACGETNGRTGTTKQALYVTTREGA